MFFVNINIVSSPGIAESFSLSNALWKIALHLTTHASNSKYTL